MPERPTAIVIGAGMSGLVSAILLAMHGWRVRVFERHIKPGGLLHRFSRAGVPFETGFHYCGSIDHDEILGRALAHLGVLDRLAWVPLDHDGFDRIVMPGMSFRVPAGLEAYRARLVEAFPHERVGIDGYLADLCEAVEHYGLYRFRDIIDTRQFLHWEGVSVDAVVERHVRDPLLRGVLTAQSSLYGVSTHEAPFGLHAVITHHFLQGPWRVRGGGDALAGALVARLEELGGEVHLRAPVARLVVDEDRRVQGVELESGERHAASLVFSSLHPRALLDLIPDEGVVRKAYRTRILDQRTGLSHFGVYAELAAPVPALDGCNLYRMSEANPRCILQDIEPDHVPFYFAASPPPTAGADGHPQHTLLLTAALRWENVAPWAASRWGQRPQAYLDLKATLRDTLLEAFFADHPEVRPLVRRVETSTALSTWHFVRSPQGAMYGHYHSIPQMGRYRLPQIIRIHNLVQVGQGVFTPGILGATLSAYYGCGYHLGLARLVAELEAT
ncbi:MAG: NAD(P)/FAD-dependent oxidoreductase [Pseudomonadota bacterium]